VGQFEFAPYCHDKEIQTDPLPGLAIRQSRVTFRILNLDFGMQFDIVPAVMDAATTHLEENSAIRTPLTRNQIWGFWASWGGWTLDGMDSFIYALVLVPDCSSRFFYLDGEWLFCGGRSATNSGAFER
jgi:hypothetical protein